MEAAAEAEAEAQSSSSLNLVFHEEVEDQLNVNDEDDDDYHLMFNLEYEDDYIKNLVQKELRFESDDKPSPSPSSDYPNSRIHVVNWILNTRNQLNYRNQTAYLSVSYLDRFLSIRHIDEDKMWAIRLLSVACLSLAAKMEEWKVPTLSEYPVSELGFDCKAIKRMELLVLSVFKWKMSLVTPFGYLHYFIKKLGDQTIESHDLFSKAVELVMALIQEIRLIEYRPSVIAAAAVLAASDWQMTQETLKLKVTSLLWKTSDNQQQQEEQEEQEHQLLSCYSIMQRLCTKVNISTTPNLTEVDHQTSDHTTPSIVGTKRRLTFSDTDPSPSNPEKNRRE